jgi:2'-5' RNA ligase
MEVSNKYNINNTKCAICIIPPIDKLSYVQDIRSKYDRAFDRWMPHINLVFPFVESDKIDEVVNKLEPILSQIPTFAIKFKNFDAFKRKKDATFHLVPEAAEKKIEVIQQLINIIISNLDETRNFHPHLTVGQCKKDELPLMLENLEKDFKEHQFIYLCDSIHIIERDDDTPFQIKKTIKLKSI